MSNKARINDVIQIINERHNWYPCLLIVHQPADWGVTACTIVPTDKGTTQGWIRIPNEDFVVIGPSVIGIRPDPE